MSTEFEIISKEELNKNIESLNSSLSIFKSKVELCQGTLSVSGFIKDVAQHFTVGLKGFADGFIKFLSFDFSSNNPIPQYKDFNSFKSKAISLTTNDKVINNFGKISSLDIAYISSCRATLNEVCTGLKNIGDKTGIDTLKALRVIDLYVSNALSNPEYRKTVKPFKPDQDLKALVEQTSNIKDLNVSIIDSTSLEDHKLIIKILPSLQELREITNDLNIMKSFTDVKALEKVDEVVKSISIKAKTLAEEVEKDGNCSKVFLNNIKEILTIGAEGVTYLATYYYLHSQAIQSYKTLVTAIDKGK